MQEEDQFYIQPEQQQFRQIKNVDDPIPLFDKPRIDEPKNIPLKMIDIPKKQHSYTYIPFRMKKYSSSSEHSNSDNQSCQQLCDSHFKQCYAQSQCVYKKYHNQSFNKMNNVCYYSGRFIYKGILVDNIIQQIKDLDSIIKEYYDVSTLPLPSAQPNELIFDSNFESGNLFAAFKINSTEYDLVMENDTNSKGNNQWFYFKVEGMVNGVEYTFNVVNFTKSDSLFNYGMNPAIFSKIGHQKAGQQWCRMGRDVVYKKGTILRQNSHRFYYKLTFKLTSKYASDTLYIAHSYPYTFSHLKQFINNRVSRNKDIVTKIQIGKSLAKYPIYALEISLQINKKRDNRKAIIILARQHPGQTQGSFVCQGVIDKLLARTKQSQFLRKTYIIYVIPMVNPDGVVFGHYRTNLAGCDLNRKWDSTDKDLSCPQVVLIKGFLQELNKQRDIRFILDLHGHSKKLNSFFYGNPCPDTPQTVRIFPFLCSKINPAIQFADCTFATEEYKKKAARVYLSFLYKLIHVYTFETSFYGFVKEGRKVEFTPKQFKQLGHTLVQCLFLQLQHQAKYQQSFDFNQSKIINPKEYNSSIFVKILTQLKANQALLEIGSKAQSGSESKPDEMEVNLNDIPIARSIIRDFSTPQISEETNQKSISKVSMKAQREHKEKEIFSTKPIRNLKVMEISQVNSVLPDKYQLGLQPIRKKGNIEQLTRNVSSIIRFNSECQTEKSQALTFKDINIKQIQQKNHLSSSARAETPNLRDRRYSSVVKTITKNNIIFKIDLLSRQSMTKINPQFFKQPTKHAYSQTVISFAKQRAIQKIKPTNLFPTVESPERQTSESKWLKVNAIRYDSTRIGMKRQAELFLNGMVKKYFAEKQLKIKQHAYSKFGEKPLTIKKKQIYPSKK